MAVFYKFFQKNWHFVYFGWIILLTTGCISYQFVETEVISVLPQTAAMRNAPCTDQKLYHPDAQSPERVVRINFHVLRNNEGADNFSETEGIAYLKTLVAQANEKLASNKKMNLPNGNATPILPTKYRYEITPTTNDPNDQGIYFHNDSDLYWYKHKGKGATNLYQRGMFEKYGQRKGDVMNIFVLSHHPDSTLSKTYNLTATGVAFPNENWLKLAGLYHLQFDTMGFNAQGQPITKGSWFCVGVFNHEIGHVLGLMHTWGGDNCDDTPNNPNCWAYNEQPPCNTQFSNNIMDYNTYQDAWTPCQLGTVHRLFAQKGSPQRKMLQPTWCKFDPAKTVTVGDSTTWAGAKDLQGDVVVTEGAFLRILCRVNLAKGAKIVVHPRATLLLDGATLENECGENWEGIQIVRKGQQQGKVVFGKMPTLRNLAHDLDYEVLERKVNPPPKTEPMK